MSILQEPDSHMGHKNKDVMEFSNNVGSLNTHISKRSTEDNRCMSRQNINWALMEKSITKTVCTYIL